MDEGHGFRETASTFVASLPLRWGSHGRPRAGVLGLGHCNHWSPSPTLRFLPGPVLLLPSPPVPRTARHHLTSHAHVLPRSLILVFLVQPATLGPPPKDVPPPTPVELPSCTPQPSAAPDAAGHASVVRLLQSLRKPSQLNEPHYAALGLHVHADTPAEHLLPDPSYLPAPSGWDTMTVDDARAKDPTFRRPLSNGNMSPEARAYLERRTELSIDNQAAFRTVKRIRPQPGQKPVRLGNCYEFFRQLELMAGYWDDTSQPPISYGDDDEQTAGSSSPAPPGPGPGPGPKPLDASLEQAQQAIAGASVAHDSSNTSSQPKDGNIQRTTYRTSPGSAMPAEIRHGLITAFVKLVSYDFGCNVSPPRVEPRLHLREPAHPPGTKGKQASRPPRVSYFPSGCNFIFRTPTSRDEARHGYMEGPLVAVSARNLTNFKGRTDHNVDFGRELVAALATAQLRARQGKQEKRFGDGQWWTTRKRWGGGEGGPIGREVESVGPLESETDGSLSHRLAEKPPNAQPNKADGVSPTSAQEKSNRPEQNHAKHPHSPPTPLAISSGLPMRGAQGGRKSRKNMSMYDSYRRVKPPSSNWDKKTKYMPIGRQQDVPFDDVFVISSVFHHVCIIRARVPDRLLDVFDGAPEEEGGEERSWGKLEIWRSPWFDLFKPEERLEALRLLWGLNAWLMRADTAESPAAAGTDAPTKGT